MKMKKSILMLVCFILFFSGFTFLKDHRKRPPSEVTYKTAYEHNYFVIKDQIRRNYSISSSHIKVLQTEKQDRIRFVLFSFMDETHHYIGQLTYLDENQENPENPRIPEDTVKSLKIHSLKDKKTPFRMMTSMITVDQMEYCFYYGWINDENVQKIEFDFIDARFEVHPDGQKYFHLLRNKNMKMNKTTAFDSNSLVIQEYTY
ncbi:hypothetical protein ACHAL6_02675 [Proteiniclasticum sp. C24MP]|uniref:hypothetical protein n=1 Tax=Proteiniclasticum sp. C24MP TaxID=3374101 RepID=UPI003753E919